MSSTKNKDAKETSIKNKDVKEKPRSKEIILYEQAMKRYNDDLKLLHDAALKKALYEEGLNTSKISRQDMDEIKRIRDKQGPMRQKYQEQITKAQQEAQEKIAAAQAVGQGIIDKINAEYQEEITTNQKALQDLIDRLRKEQGVTKPEPETEKEEGKEQGSGQEENKEGEETKK